MNNKLSVTIGIPVYNEEKNIGYLLKSILSQQETNFDIKQIIIISDASCDGTDKIIESIKDNRIKFIKNKTRKSQINCQNKIFALADTDVVVLFEADTCPKDNHYLAELLLPVIKDKRIGVVQGNAQPLKPITFIEKILYAQDQVFYKFTKDENQAEELFISGGGGRAFLKEVYKKLIWPEKVPEDMYDFLWCKKQNIKIKFSKSAVCFYRIPQTFQDYVKKRNKVISGEKALREHFSNKSLNKHYTLSLPLIMKMMIYFLITRPHHFFGYLTIRFFGKRIAKDKIFTDYWETASSTKKLFS